MKTVKRGEGRAVFQGDLMMIRADKIPAEATRAKTNVVAFSETHHHHVATGCEVLTMPGDPMTLFLKAKGKHIDIVHQRPFDTHETIRLLTKPGDTFKLRRQREWTPEGWRRVED